MDEKPKDEQTPEKTPEAPESNTQASSKPEAETTEPAVAYEGGSASTAPAPEIARLTKIARLSTYYHLLLVPIIIFLGDAIISIIDKIGKWAFEMPKIDPA